MRKLAHGLTLIELMVALAVLAVLLVVAVPYLRNFVMNNRLATQANTLASALALARGEAARRNVPVAVVATAGDWSKGYQLGVDSDRDGTIDGDLIRSFGAAPAGVTITTGNGLTALTFFATGLVDNAETFVFCDDRTGETGRRVEVLQTGRTEVLSNACP